MVGVLRSAARPTARSGGLRCERQVRVHLLDGFGGGAHTERRATCHPVDAHHHPTRNTCDAYGQRPAVLDEPFDDRAQGGGHLTRCTRRVEAILVVCDGGEQRFARSVQGCEVRRRQLALLHTPAHRDALPCHLDAGIEQHRSFAECGQCIGERVVCNIVRHRVATAQVDRGVHVTVRGWRPLGDNNAHAGPVQRLEERRRTRDEGDQLEGELRQQPCVQTVQQPGSAPHIDRLGQHHNTGIVRKAIGQCSEHGRLAHSDRPLHRHMHRRLGTAAHAVIAVAPRKGQAAGNCSGRGFTQCAPTALQPQRGRRELPRRLATLQKLVPAKRSSDLVFISFAPTTSRQRRGAAICIRSGAPKAAATSIV